MPIRIVPASLEDPQIIALLRHHLGGMRNNSPPGLSFALDLDGLRGADISFWAAWDADALLGFGAVKELTRTSGEIKSMRTHDAHLRKGVGALVLEHLVALCRERGYKTVSLETGTGESFRAAIALYERYGFVKGPAFGAYEETPFNQFFHLAL